MPPVLPHSLSKCDPGASVGADDLKIQVEPRVSLEIKSMIKKHRLTEHISEAKLYIIASPVGPSMSRRLEAARVVSGTTRLDNHLLKLAYGDPGPLHSLFILQHKITILSAKKIYDTLHFPCISQQSLKHRSCSYSALTLLRQRCSVQCFNCTASYPLCT
jgi:hypothetical protein